MSPNITGQQAPEVLAIEPVFLNDIALAALLQRYQLYVLTPVSKLEYQLACLCAGLERRVQELEQKV